MRAYCKLLIWCLFGQSLLATLRPDPGCMAFDVEFLYLYATYDDTYYTTQSRNFSNATSVLDGERVNNDSLFRPAFRIEGIYGFPDPDQYFRVRWTYLNSSSTDSQGLNRGIFLTESAPEIAAVVGNKRSFSKLDFRFQTVEMLLEGLHTSFSYLSFSFYTGLEYAYLRMDEYARLVVPNTVIFNDCRFYNRMWGVGPQIGISSYLPLSYKPGFLPASFDLVGTLNGSLLVSQSWSTSSSSQNNTAFRYLELRDEPIWRAVPIWNARLGVNSLFSLNRYHLALELGYEFFCFYHALPKLAFMGQNYATSNQRLATGLTMHRYTNFNVHGPYVSVSATY